jgi:thioredoxin-like negative regulator of GroEL
MLSPLLESLTAEGSQDAVGDNGKPIALDLVTVNTDVEQDLAREFGVRQLQTRLYISGRHVPFLLRFARPRPPDGR